MRKYIVQLYNFFTSFFKSANIETERIKGYTRPVGERVEFMRGKSEKPKLRRRTKRMYLVNDKWVRFSRKFDEARRLKRLAQYAG